MLSVNHIQKHFETGRLEALMDAVADNGLELPLPLRIRLTQVPATSVAMGLRRLVELTYGPTTLSRSMTRYLLEAQEADGSFAHDPLATAAAVSALTKLQFEHRNAGEPEVALARERGLAALAAMQAEDGLFNGAHGADRTEQDRALGAAFVLFLLAGDDEFRRTVRFADALTWFESRADSLDEDTNRLWRVARLGAPKTVKKSAAVAAIAA